MIKMKALRSFGIRGSNEGPVKRGREFQARDRKRADELEAHGLAHRMYEKAEMAPLNKMEPNPKNQMEPSAPANKSAEQGPLDSAGGETGATEPAPSSPPDRRRRGRQSKDSADDLLS